MLQLHKQALYIRPWIRLKSCRAQPYQHSSYKGHQSFKYGSTHQFHSLYIKDILPDCMAGDYPRNSPHHQSQTKAETERLVRAFCEPVEKLWEYVQTSGHHPMGWQDTDVFPRVREAHELIVEVKGYLVSLRPRPTTEEVRAILQKLQEVARAHAQVRNHRDDSSLTIRLRRCGRPCQAYVAYIDPEQSMSLPWQNGMTRMQTAEERRGLPPQAHVQTLLLRMQKLLS
jgi:hypothetical protein